jgi:hypothetical protein
MGLSQGRDQLRTFLLSVLTVAFLPNFCGYFHQAHIHFSCVRRQMHSLNEIYLTTCIKSSDHLESSEE